MYFSWTILRNLLNICDILEEQFYRVQISVQSPEGVTTMRGILRRFDDFLKLLVDVRFSNFLNSMVFNMICTFCQLDSKNLTEMCFMAYDLQLKRAFPKKTIPSNPPKGILRVKSREMLEEVCKLLWSCAVLFKISLFHPFLLLWFLNQEHLTQVSCKLKCTRIFVLYVKHNAQE